MRNTKQMSNNHQELLCKTCFQVPAQFSRSRQTHGNVRVLGWELTFIANALKV